MKLLTSEQKIQYEQNGYVSPIRIMSTEQASLLRKRLEDFEHTQGGPLNGSLRHKTHLLFTWLNELIRNATILDAVEDLYGSDLCVGPPISLSRRRTTRHTCPGTRIRPIGVCRAQMS